MKQDCTGCKALCCRYITVQLDKPKSKRDWDRLFWYLNHKDIFIYIDHENDWMMEFKTDCKKLLPDNSCGDYVNRPTVCRGHNPFDCEHNQGDSPYKKLFCTVEELKIYLEEKRINYQYTRP
ncbi:MAG: YkgJ family cysteine cluster protein [Candidatus Woesearchaeota archaeon]